MDAKEWLSQYLPLRGEAYHLVDELERLKGNPSPLARTQFEDAEKRLNECMEEIEKINTAIEALNNPQERLILRKRYTGADSTRQNLWREIALEVYGDNSAKDMQRVYRVHAQALRNLASSPTKL